VAHRSRSFMREMLDKFTGLARTPTGRTPPPMANGAPTAGAASQRRVLMISHGGFISEFLSSAVGHHVANNARNCSVSVLAIARRHPNALPEFRLRVANETHHLASLVEPPKPPPPGGASPPKNPAGNGPPAKDAQESGGGGGGVGQDEVRRAHPRSTFHCNENFFAC